MFENLGPMLANAMAAFNQGGALQTGGQLPAQAALATKGLPAQDGSILGMTPANFAALFGQAGAAIGGPNSWQGRLGGVASQIGKGSLIAQAAEIQDIKNREFLKSLIAGGMRGGGMVNPLDNTPEGFYGRALGGLGNLSDQEKEITIKTKPTMQTQTF